MAVRTEKERMLAGESYNCLDPDLVAERQQTQALLRRYNLTEAAPERHTLLQQLLGQIGQNSIIEPPFCCSYGQNIYLGDQVYLNFLCTILDNNTVHIATFFSPLITLRIPSRFAHPLGVWGINQGLTPLFMAQGLGFRFRQMQKRVKWGIIGN